VIDDHGEFLNYTQLIVSETIQIADGIEHSVVDKDSVNCISMITLTDILHVLKFSINLPSISAIIAQLKCTVYFDILKWHLRRRAWVRCSGLEHGMMEYDIWTERGLIQH
jgi:hypothetical protein